MSCQWRRKGASFRSWRKGYRSWRWKWTTQDKLSGI